MMSQKTKLKSVYVITSACHEGSKGFSVRVGVIIV